MATVDFLPFATDVSALVIDQATYAAAGFRTLGFGAGIADEYELNKVWRQSSFVAAGLATFMGNITGTNVLDDGDLSAFVTHLTTAIQEGSSGGAGSFTTLTASSTVTFNMSNASVSLSPTGTGSVTINPATAGTINRMSIGATTAASGAFTTLTANAAVTLSPANANVILSPTGTGVVTIAPVAAGSINNMSIGATTPLAGTFTTLNSAGLNSTGLIDLSGGGGQSIKFGSGNSLSSDANTLDAYIEFTWTPSLFVSGVTGITYSVQDGWGEMIGGLVTIGFDLTVAGIGTGTGTSLVVHSVPYTSSHSSCGDCLASSLTFAVSRTGINVQLPASSTSISLMQSGSGQSTVNSQYSQIAIGTRIQGGFSYPIF